MQQQDCSVRVSAGTADAPSHRLCRFLHANTECYGYKNYRQHPRCNYGQGRVRDFVMMPTTLERGCDPFRAVSTAWIKVGHSRHAKAHSAMSSATTRSTVFEQYALPLLSALYSHACWLTRDHAEAEDLVQETLIKAFSAFDSFQQGTNFKAWIFRILRNTFLTSRTGMAASHTVFLEDHPETLDSVTSGATPEDNLIQLNNEAALYAALDQLQPPLREVLLLCDVEELKYKDIALVLDVPIGTVMSRISRARVALRQLLQPQFGESA